MKDAFSNEAQTIRISVWFTFKHVLDEDATLSDVLVDDELLVIGSYEENHFQSIVVLRLWQ